MWRKLLLPIFLVFIIIVCSVFLYPRFLTILLDLGFLTTEVRIAGTGSMYPTFPKSDVNSELERSQNIVAWPKMKKYPAGINIFGKEYFTTPLEYGDIVEFENEKTDQISQEKYQDTAGFVKRLIGLPGDTIELNDGFVFRNGKVVDEPYIAKPRSTYGGDVLPDCKKLTIPDSKVFVLGDNRKASLDSRFELGLVDTKDINFVMPKDLQKEYKSTWRDTKGDISLAHQVTLNGGDFVKLLNQKREKEKLKSLKYTPQLSLSSKRRGQVMITTDDFSLEASRSGITLKNAVKEVSYQNILYAEVFTRGFYEAEELLDNFLEFPETKKLLFSSDYQDIGVEAVNGVINNCPMQVVVTHLGGYVPPNYSTEEIFSWQKLVDNITEVFPSWESLKKADNIDQLKLNRLLEILNIRLKNANTVISKMKSKIWLSPDDLRNIELDQKLHEEAQTIISSFNK